jgi:hypothetical protein
MLKRTAPFELPYHLSGLYCGGALSALHEDGKMDSFPIALIRKLEDNSSLFGGGCEITQHDIDSLSEEAWTYLKAKLV